MTDIDENEIITVEPTPLEQMPRHEGTNPLMYDDLTLARRDKEIKAIMKDYPNETPANIQMAWDFVYSLGGEEEAMVEIKRLEALPPTPRDTQ
jgi:uncharacterized protein (DUF433 family)